MKIISIVAFIHLFTGILSPFLYLNGYYALGLFLFSVSPAVLLLLVYVILKDKTFVAPESYNNQWYQDNTPLKFSHISEWETDK
ncbi:MAG: hypothetical protein ACK4EX_06760 [Thermaurantimonas sp.]|uniref:hypothetical protein n=1 Tax=Thermaurantimonas sp. TaxID=2681568 RepID=UPI003919DB33